MEAKAIYTLKDGVKVYEFNNRDEANEFYAQEAHGVLRGGDPVVVPDGMLVAIPAAIRNGGESFCVFRNAILFTGTFGKIAYLVWA